MKYELLYIVLCINIVNIKIQIINYNRHMLHPYFKKYWGTRVCFKFVIYYIKILYKIYMYV